MVNNKPRTRTNDFIYNLVNAKINSMENRKTGEFSWKDKKIITPMSEYYTRQKRKAIVNIINKHPQEAKNQKKIMTPLKLHAQTKHYNSVNITVRLWENQNTTGG